MTIEFIFLFRFNTENNSENQIGIINKIISVLIKKANPSDMEQKSSNFFSFNL